MPAWEAAVDELRANFEEFQKKVEGDSRLIHEEIQNQSALAQAHEEVTKHLKPIQELLVASNNSQGQEVGNKGATPPTT